MSYQYSQDPEKNLPDWLKELRRRQRETGRLKSEDQEQEAAVESEDQGTTAESEAEASAEPAEPPAAEPDWLLEIRRRHQQETGGPAPRAKPDIPAEDEMPEMEADDLLSDTQPHVLEAAEEVVEERLPTELEPEPEAQFEAEPEPPQEEEAQPEAEPPEPGWLTFATDEEIEEVPFSEEPEEKAPEGVDEEEPELPDWLLQDKPEDQPSSVPAFAADDEESDLSPAELPSWLQALRPPSGTSQVEPSTSRQLLPEQESVGPLAGLSGVLPAEPEVVQFGTPRMPTGRLEITEGQQRHAATLRQLIAEEGRPKEDFGKQIALPSRILNLVIAGALLAATLIPILTGNRSATLPLTDAYPLAQPVFTQIELLPPDVPVLVAFDVEPGLYGEIQAPAGTVLAHLLDQQARLVFISTQPTGPALAERLLQEQLSIDPNVATGNFIDLGYLSGGMAALRAFAEDPRRATTEIAGLPDDPWERPQLQNIETLNDFGMVLVISSETEDGRAWIEQTAPVLTNGLYMVTSAQAAPLMRPYAGSHPQTLRGLVAGLAGGAHYEVMQGRSGAARASWDAFSYGLGASVILILLGGLYRRLIHLRPEPEAPEEGGDA